MVCNTVFCVLVFLPVCFVCRPRGLVEKNKKAIADFDFPFDLNSLINSLAQPNPWSHEDHVGNDLGPYAEEVPRHITFQTKATPKPKQAPKRQVYRRPAHAGQKRDRSATREHQLGCTRCRYSRAGCARCRARATPRSESISCSVAAAMPCVLTMESNIAYKRHAVVDL